MKSMVDLVVDVLDEACWDGYTQVGMKKKGGKMTKAIFVPLKVVLV